MEAEIYSFAEHTRRREYPLSLNLGGAQPETNDLEFGTEYPIYDLNRPEADEYYLSTKPWWTNWEAYVLLVSGSTDPVQENEDWCEWKEWERQYEQYKQGKGEALPQLLFSVTQDPDLLAALSEAEIDRLMLLMRAITYMEGRIEGIPAEAEEAELKINVDGSFHRGSKHGQRLNDELEELTNNLDLAISETADVKNGPYFRAREAFAAQQQGNRAVWWLIGGALLLAILFWHQVL